MKTQKTNGKIGFELVNIVSSFLASKLGKDWRNADLVSACEGNLNDFASIKSKASIGAVTTKAKAGTAQYGLTTVETMQGKADVVNAFLTWHDRVESRAAKALKDGVQSTVISFPETCGFSEWVMGFAAKEAAKPATVKIGRAHV